MSELLDRAFPFTEQMDPYAEELYMEFGNGITGGLSALTVYYRHLARPDLTPEDAYKEAAKAVKLPPTVVVEGVYVNVLEEYEPPRRTPKRQTFLGRVANFVSGALEPSGYQPR